MPTPAPLPAPQTRPPADDASIVRAEQLTRHYPSGHTVLEVLRGVSLDVRRGEVVAIVGESGTGKSTLLHLLGALDRPTSGTVYFEGSDIFAKDDEALARFRNRSIGFVFQFHHLLPEFTALENTAMPALIRGLRFSDVRERALELLRTLGVDQRAEHRPAALSGGEQQRVAIARALMNEPGLVLADEPTGNLDTNSADRLHQEILRLAREFGQTFVIATHNPELSGLADRVLRLEQGILHSVENDR